MADLPLVLIRGAGDLASGVALRLFRCGFPIVMTEIRRPLAVRRTVSFAQAVFDGATQVEEVGAVLCVNGHVSEQLAMGMIPILIDPSASSRGRLHPAVLVDAIMAKKNLGTTLGDARLVVALGPGFTAGVDCHAVVETNRGHNLGRVIWNGAAEPDTGRPGTLPGALPGIHRALYSPIAGRVSSHYKIGDSVHEGAVIATVASDDGETHDVVAGFDGVLRGLVHPSVPVAAHTKIGDLDPRIQPRYCFTVSDKSLAVGGAVLEAILTAMRADKLPQ
ncbi:MAG: selenium-dependent molybdenum cofactor biosynthesis protein YqeB [Caldilineaceae bacterium]